MNREYARYLEVQRILNLNKTPNTQYEFQNILERFFISMAEFATTEAVFAKLPKTHKVYKQLKKELKDKHIKQDIGEIKKAIDTFLVSDYPPVIYRRDKYTFYCGSHIFRPNKARIDAMDKWADTEAILKVILRYGSIPARGQNWNLPLPFYKFIYDNYNVRLEGFASPLNSQLLLLGKDVRFCSLFPDTDAPFGSLGSVFDLDIDRILAKQDLSATLHPPYILEILVKMVDLIYRWFEVADKYKRKLLIFAGFPMWDDIEELVNKLINFKYTKYYKMLKPKEFYFENSMLQHPTPITPPTLHRRTFIFANFEHKIPYSEAIKRLKL